jgi:hypothetical protein
MLSAPVHSTVGAAARVGNAPAAAWYFSIIVSGF